MTIEGFLPMHRRVSRNAPVSRGFRCSLFVFGLSLIPCARLAAQTPPPPDLNAARSFVRNLPIGAAREQILAGSGRANTEALLMRVFDQGLSPAASLEDWADLHLALSGLVDLYIAQATPTGLLTPAPCGFNERRAPRSRGRRWAIERLAQSIRSSWSAAELSKRTLRISQVTLRSGQPVT